MIVSDVYDRPLFARHPQLARAFPLARLAELPTPVRFLEKLASRSSASKLWLKDDGPSSPFYGGNKVRKLELVLAAARETGATSVVTFGYAGSNHATATAVHASRLGLRSISVLLPQLNAPYVRKNLLVSAAVGAELHEYRSRHVLYAGAILAILRRRRSEGRPPFVIPAGGSSPLGTIGFVNAAYELDEQVADGVLPLPDRIYVSAGSLGTCVGLGIGMAALRHRTKIVGVRVVGSRFVNESRMRALWKKTVALLREKDPSFPDVGDPASRITLRDEFYGGEYARTTPESADAQRLAAKLEGIELDVTYTSKALACALADARNGLFPIGPVLFWNTCNSSDLSDLAADVQPANFPKRLRRYFELDETF